jgi:type II secretory pathway pseudopilin PulG
MNQSKDESGFSILDVMVAITILMVGIMAMVSAMTSAVVMTNSGQQQLQAKQIAVSTMESIFSAHDINVLGYSSIQNITSGSCPGTCTTPPCGVFPTGDLKVYAAYGPDGVAGTCDDSYGLDGLPNTSDDTPAIQGFTRQIIITGIDKPSDIPGSNLRQIQVIVSYPVGKTRMQQTLTSYIANYRTGTS